MLLLDNFFEYMILGFATILMLMALVGVFVLLLTDLKLLISILFFVGMLYIIGLLMDKIGRWLFQ